MSAPPIAASRWMHGPALDLLIGCGGLYCLVFLASPWLVGSDFGHGARLFLPLAVLLISVPHYGGTLLRVYESSDERRKYAFFTVWATAALFAWFVAGVYDFFVGSLMLTLYLSWSPWHYSGQNYGIGLMFLRRRGVPVSTVAKRALYASFVLSFLLAVLVLHGDRGGADDAAGLGRTAIEFVPIGLSASWVDGVTWVALAGYLGALAVAAISLLRVASLRDLAPAALMIATQALWFVAPYSARYAMANVSGGAGAAYILDSMMWVAIAHAAQYLWITSWYASKAARVEGASTQPGGRLGFYSSYFGKVMLAGSLIWTVPLLLFAPWALGTHPFGTGLVFLVAAFVNLHHFVIDGAIWKLRDGPVASLLIRDRPQDARPEATLIVRPARGRLVRVAVWTIAGVSVGVQAWISLRADIGFPWAVSRGNLAAAETVLEQTGWVGGDSAQRRLVLARQYRRAGETDRAVAQLESGLATAPDGSILLRTLGEIEVERRQFDAALDHAQRALAVDARDAQAHLVAGAALVGSGRTVEAIDHYRRAVELDGSLARAHGFLGNALVETGALEDAVRHYTIALQLEPELRWVRERLGTTRQRLRDQRFFGATDS